jgi:type II secretory pathway pseudopilin PulG
MKLPQISTDNRGFALSESNGLALSERSESNGLALSERSESNGLALSERSESKGFTLFEIIIVVALMIGFFALGSLVDLNIINRRSISAEQATLVSVLQKARNRSMNNIYASEHKVKVDVNSYILSYNNSEGIPVEEFIKRNNNIEIKIEDKNGDVDEIIFEQLSGNLVGFEEIIITLGGSQQDKEIRVKENGLIDW